MNWVCVDPQFSQRTKLQTTNDMMLKSDSNLFLASKEDRLDILLLNLVDEKGPGVMTCTLLAAEVGNMEVLKYLVDEREAKCDDTIQNNLGRTCTMLAVSNGHLDVVKYLVDEKKGAKCDITIRDNDGWTCTMHSVQHNHLNVLRYLVDEKGANCDDTIHDDLYRPGCFKRSSGGGEISGR